MIRCNSLHLCCLSIEFVLILLLCTGARVLTYFAGAAARPRAFNVFFVNVNGFPCVRGSVMLKAISYVSSGSKHNWESMCCNMLAGLAKL